jgi:hypothetical protein
VVAQSGGVSVERTDHDGQTKQELLAQLNEEHRELKARLRELGRHIALTSAEKVEYAQLKKMKLRTKDRIRMLEQN